MKEHNGRLFGSLQPDDLLGCATTVKDLMMRVRSNSRRAVIHRSVRMTVLHEFLEIKTREVSPRGFCRLCPVLS